VARRHTARGHLSLGRTVVRTQRWVVVFISYSARQKVLVIGFVDTYELSLSMISGIWLGGVSFIPFILNDTEVGIRARHWFWRSRRIMGYWGRPRLFEIVRGLGFVSLEERVTN